MSDITICKKLFLPLLQQFCPSYLSLCKRTLCLLFFTNINSSPFAIKADFLQYSINGIHVQILTNSPVHKKSPRNQEFQDFFERCEPDLNRRITVLQTGALPLGYRTILN